MGPIGCLDTSVRNYHFTLCNIPEERRSHLHRGGSLNSRTAGRQIDVCGVDWLSGELVTVTLAA